MITSGTISQRKVRFARPGPLPRPYRPGLEPLEDRTLLAVGFRTVGPILLGGSLADVAARDFNGDGKSDLAVTNVTDFIEMTRGTVAILLGNGDGTFQTAGRYPVSVSPQAVAVGDFNGDGKADLVVTSGFSAQDDGGIDILLGNGDGTFQAPVPSSVGSPAVDPLRTVVGDFNGDGKSDLAVLSSVIANGSGVVSILLGKGDGTFQAPAGYAAGTFPSSLAAGDFNGDGRPDLVTTNQGSQDLSVLLGNGDGSFQPPAGYSLSQSSSSVQVADVNGDGKLDLVAANGTVNVLLGNGDGSFRSPVSSPIGSFVTASAVGDLNGDGKPDLIAADAGSNTVDLLLGNGDGTFGPPVNYPVEANPNGRVQALVVRDFNGDAVPDIVTANFETNTGNPAGSVTVLLSGNQHATTTTTTLTASPNQVLAGQPVTLTATVAPSGTGAGTATGSVAFVQQTTVFMESPEFAHPTPTVIMTLLGTAPVDASGHAVLTTPLSIGSLDNSTQLPIDAVYGGDSNFTPSTSPQVTVTVGKVSTTLTLTATPNPAPAGQPVTVTATVMAPHAGLSGTLEVDLDNAFRLTQVNPQSDTRGEVQATVSLPNLSVGAHEVEAFYFGDANFGGTSARVTVLVQPASVPGAAATPGQRLVAQFYQDLLGRQAGPTDLAFWGGLLDQGQSRTQVALGIVGSTEYRTRVVTQLYTQLLKRPADPDGLQSSLALLAQGATEEQLEVLLLGSDEYLQTRGQGTAGGFVQAVYQDVLRRSPSPGELQGWLQLLGGGLSRPAVALAILTSAEAESGEVQSLYLKLLQRAADGPGLGFFVGALQGGASREQVAATLEGSQERFAAVNGPLHQRYVAQLYRDLLGREGGAADFNYWAGLLDQGLATPVQVVRLIEQSLEYLTRQVQLLYTTYLHRAADAGGLSSFVSFLSQGGTLEQAAVILTSSAEYFQAHGGTDAGIVLGLFQDALGRPPDPAGQAAFVQILAQGGSRSQAAAAVFGSDEYRQDVVQRLYQKVLHRPADAGALAAWVDLLGRGARDEQLLAVLAASEEYFRRVP